MTTYALFVCGTEADIQIFLDSLKRNHPIHEVKREAYENDQIDIFMGRIVTRDNIDFSEIGMLCAQCDNRIQAGITSVDDSSAAIHV